MATGARPNDAARTRSADTERTCVVTRRAGRPEDLIRFVVSPDGVIVPDVAHRLPGRGVWVTGDRTTVSEAVRSKAFNKSLRRQVTIPADLPDQVDALLVRRLVDALALANKAGLVTTGFTRTEAAILASDAFIVAHASDAAPDGVKKLDRLYTAIARETGRTPNVVRLLDVMQMSLAIGRSNVVHAALKPGGAARRFLEEAQRLVRYRHLPADEIVDVSPAPAGGDGALKGRPTGNE
jgi:predicted RNA-binding protein YlxR (DUF448 family)